MSAEEKKNHVPPAYAQLVDRPEGRRWKVLICPVCSGQHYHPGTVRPGDILPRPCRGDQGPDGAAKCYRLAAVPAGMVPALEMIGYIERPFLVRGDRGQLFRRVKTRSEAIEAARDWQRGKGGAVRITNARIVLLKALTGMIQGEAPLGGQGAAGDRPAAGRPGWPVPLQERRRMERFTVSPDQAGASSKKFESEDIAE